jgi:GNAT superfamily N-acetyltransferase
MDGTIAAYAWCGHTQWSFHPQRFALDIFVRPEYQRRGVGSALFGQITTLAESMDGRSLSTQCREDKSETIRFLENRGFLAGMREWESRLDLGEFDPSVYTGYEQKVLDQGIRMATLRELREEDPDCHRKVYDMVCSIEADVPRSEAEFTPPDFELFQTRLENSLNLLPDGYCIAVANGEYVGVSSVHSSQATNDLEVGLTGVRRDYRRRGIALALKVKATTWAKEQGYPLVKTWNATSNDRMLDINVRLGFRRQPAWVEYKKMIQENGE